jgi:hypothetical protein
MVNLMEMALPKKLQLLSSLFRRMAVFWTHSTSTSTHTTLVPSESQAACNIDIAYHTFIELSVNTGATMLVTGSTT